MTKTRKMKPTPTRHNSGFTLIEMLVVAALIAIFAGLAVFNIVEQLNREKEKAALAEARSIATAMSFAHNDMGFYPKLCFLRFGVDELAQLIAPTGPLPFSGIDWFDRGGPNMRNQILSNWGEKYMAGSMPEKFVTMTLNFRNGGSQDVRWPCDPFNTPYTAYLLKIGPAPGAPAGSPPVISWADDTLGDQANYFAGVISYGRNKVPGFAWNDPTAMTRGENYRLFAGPVGGNQRHFTMSPTVFDQARLEWFTDSEPNPTLGEPFTNPPHPRDAGSDDKYFEF